MVQIDPKLLDGSGEVPKPNIVIGDSILDHKIVPLRDRKLARWSIASYIPIKKEKRAKCKSLIC